MQQKLWNHHLFVDICGILPPGSLTARPWTYTIPKGKACLPTIHFSGASCSRRAVKLREGIFPTMYFQMGGCLHTLDIILWWLGNKTMSRVTFCAEILRSPVEVGSWNPTVYRVLDISGGCLGFLNHQQYVVEMFIPNQTILPIIANYEFITTEQTMRVGRTYMGRFLKWYPTTIGFPTKNDHFVMFWGYPHFRKHPYTAFLFEAMVILLGKC